MTDLNLHGCTREPLAGYLKALAVLRIVSEQKDRNARGFWKGNSFVLRSIFETPQELTEFFMTQYSPSPIFRPWNNSTSF